MSATESRDLRAGSSIWQARNAAPVPQAALRHDTRTDVLVVGAGISGALIADALSDAGFAALIVDRRGAVLGSTPASTALLQYDLDVPLHLLTQKIGRQDAERIWGRSRLALDALRERQRYLQIDADAVNRDTLYLEGTLLDADGLRKEANARRRAGFQTTFLAAAEVRDTYGIDGRAALCSFDSLAVDPRRLATGFLNASIRRGARLLVPVEVTDVHADSGGIAATTASGPVIRSAALVFATGYEFPRYVPQNNHSMQSTWAMATFPQQDIPWPTRCFIWESSEPYLYLRTGPDDRVICGGEDECFSDEDHRNELLEAKVEAIRKKLGKLLPRLDTRPEFKWCGTFGITPTGAPCIGPIPGMPNCYAALGYGGNGITFSMMAAQMLCTMISGNEDVDAALVSLLSCTYA